MRAVVVVRDHAMNVKSGELDGTMNQRMSKAVTEAFVAVQIGESTRDLIDWSDSEVLRSLYLLVSYRQRNFTLKPGKITQCLSSCPALQTPSLKTRGYNVSPHRQGTGITGVAYEAIRTSCDRLVVLPDGQVCREPVGPCRLVALPSEPSTGYHQAQPEQG